MIFLLEKQIIRLSVHCSIRTRNWLRQKQEKCQFCLNCFFFIYSISEFEPQESAVYCLVVIYYTIGSFRRQNGLLMQKLFLVWWCSIRWMIKAYFFMGDWFLTFTFVNTFTPVRRGYAKKDSDFLMCCTWHCLDLHANYVELYKTRKSIKNCDQISA